MYADLFLSIYTYIYICICMYMYVCIYDTTQLLVVLTTVGRGPTREGGVIVRTVLRPLVSVKILLQIRRPFGVAA